MAKKKLKTVYLVVGEGQTEKAFLNHLKSIFRGNSKIQIKSAGGKGPDNVLNSALAEYKQGAFKKICVFMDNDLPIPKKLSDECKKKGIKVILNDPCFEATLLKMLGVKLPAHPDNKNCKKEFSKYNNESSTCSNTYSKLFQEDSYKEIIKTVKQIEDLKSFYMG